MSKDLRNAFFNDLADGMEWVVSDLVGCVRDPDSVSDLESPSARAAYKDLHPLVAGHEDALAYLLRSATRTVLHTALVAIDNGTACAEVGALDLVDEHGASLGPGLHELFFDVLLDRGLLDD